MSNATADSVRGYGPRVGHRLIFDGNPDKYELWEIKFIGHLRLQKLYDVLTSDSPDAEKNANIFAELVQLLDDRSLSLVMRDAVDDGKNALKILREHYLGTSKPRIISLYTELTTLKFLPGENMTDFLIRAENAATSLKTAGEVISDSLLIAMILKGLPEDYKTFSTVIMQSTKTITFSEFKVALRSQEESENVRGKDDINAVDNVMKNSCRSKFSNFKNDDNRSITCFSCNQPGHKSFQCPVKQNRSNNSKSKNRWCMNCKNNSHDTKFCRANKSQVKVFDDQDDHTFAFKVSNLSQSNDDSSILVDCGATVHIIKDKSKFIKFDDEFNKENHVIELADGSRSSGMVVGRGNANIILNDSTGKSHKVLLNNALCIPTYKEDIFSVRAAIHEGATVKFTPDYAYLEAPNGTRFNINEYGKLYFLNKVNSVLSYPIDYWHRIMGHCNVADIIKAENVVNGMRITDKKKFDCSTCIKSKMTQNFNREPDDRATKPLELVHSDLAGPIDPIARDGYRYAISFVDDYSGAISVYFLKSKNEATAAAEKFLSDSSPYGSVRRLRTDNGTEYTCAEFKSLMLKNKIKHEFSAPYSPHQNGTAERNWRSLFEMARCILLESNLPKSFWAYAVKISAYIRNRCYNTRTQVTPYESLTGKKPNVNNMNIFGSVCYAYIQNKKKLDPRSEEGVFVGHDGSSPAYLVYFPKTNQVKRVRCVKFKKYDLEIPEVYIYPKYKESEPNVPTTVCDDSVEGPEPEPELTDKSVQPSNDGTK